MNRFIKIKVPFERCDINLRWIIFTLGYILGWLGYLWILAFEFVWVLTCHLKVLSHQTNQVGEERSCASVHYLLLKYSFHVRALRSFVKWHMNASSSKKRSLLCNKHLKVYCCLRPDLQNLDPWNEWYPRLANSMNLANPWIS